MVTLRVVCVYTVLAALLGSAIARDYGDAQVERVTSIYDGDTFRVDIAGWPRIIGERVPIRLRGADTPEMRGKCQAEKELARKAKQFTVAALRNASTIELRDMERGKYFRIVADVEVDARDLGEELIAAGLAHPYDGGARVGWCSH
ncbi:nuclease [Salinisphaera dokdonensis CL-ES53]|uniref:Nuclease n=1 Tax=Salinisphaera dokdonensis CL-ES53 TaxID=1304272 RepID=A0ABV2B2C1_9GAMM